jgi:hypothetical protein
MANTDATSCPDAITEEMKKFQGTWKQIASPPRALAQPGWPQGTSSRNSPPALRKPG